MFRYLAGAELQGGTVLTTGPESTLSSTFTHTASTLEAVLCMHEAIQIILESTCRMNELADIHGIQPR
jgi:hypothetical protein